MDVIDSTKTLPFECLGEDFSIPTKMFEDPKTFTLVYNQMKQSKFNKPHNFY